MFSHIYASSALKELKTHNQLVKRLEIKLTGLRKLTLAHNKPELKDTKRLTL